MGAAGRPQSGITEHCAVATRLAECVGIRRIRVMRSRRGLGVGLLAAVRLFRIGGFHDGMHRWMGGRRSRSVSTCQAAIIIRSRNGFGKGARSAQVVRRQSRQRHRRPGDRRWSRREGRRQAGDPRVEIRRGRDAREPRGSARQRRGNPGNRGRRRGRIRGNCWDGCRNSGRLRKRRGGAMRSREELICQPRNERGVKGIARAGGIRRRRLAGIKPWDRHTRGRSPLRHYRGAQ